MEWNVFKRKNGQSKSAINILILTNMCTNITNQDVLRQPDEKCCEIPEIQAT